jgi:hypothetical protein
MKIKSQATTGLFCFLLTVFSLSEAKESTDPTTSAVPSPYPVMDSGVWADAVHSPTIFWLSNDRLIFKGTEATQKVDAFNKTHLQIWDIEKSKITPYAPTTKGIACYTDGVIFYWVRGDKIGEDRYRYGKLGEEKTMELPKNKKTFIDTMNCRLHDVDALMKERQGRAIHPLLDRHGYLDRGSIRFKPGIKEPAIFYRTGHSKGIELPILGRDATIIRYYPFKDAYLIHDLNTGGILNKKKQFWWLYPDGKVEEGLFHFETNLYPTRKGIVTMWGGTRSAKDPGTVGLYLWNQQEPIKLIAGYAEGITVSPDGCKLAFVHFLYSDATKIKDPGRITLKAINVCMEEKNHGQ